MDSLLSDTGQQAFLHVLDATGEKYKWLCHSFCLLDICCLVMDEWTRIEILISEVHKVSIFVEIWCCLASISCIRFLKAISKVIKTPA